MRNSIFLAWLFVAFLLVVPLGRAQAQRLSCPGLRDSAGAEKQAVCWFEADSRGGAQCEAKRGGVSPCTLQSVAWCADAALEEAAVSNACFLSNVRAGQFEEALSIVEYLQKPSEEAKRCRKALRSISIQIVSEPAGAQVEVDDRPLGQAPVEATLGENWWKSRVKARFGSGKEAMEVVAAGERLMAAFDRRRCEMAELVLRGPMASESEPPSEAQKAEGSVGQQTDLSVKDQGVEQKPGVSVPGVALVAVGGAALITGVVLVAIAESRAGNISSPKDNPAWSSVESDYKSVTPFRIGGWTCIGAGAVMAAVGAVLLAGGSGEKPSEGATSAVADLANGRVSWQW
jgi:hypothetical protein